MWCNTMSSLIGHPVQALVVASLLTISIFLFTKLVEKRHKQFAHLPQLPTSLLWGHLQLFARYTKHGAQDRHPGNTFPLQHRPPTNNRQKMQSLLRCTRILDPLPSSWSTYGPSAIPWQSSLTIQLPSKSRDHPRISNIVYLNRLQIQASAL